MTMEQQAEDYLQCPYEVSHVIRAEKMQFHLTKCRYVNKDLPLLDCPFNTTHKINEIEMNFHKQHMCPDRKKLDTFLYSTTDTKSLFPVEHIDVPCEENWDNEQVPTYNPEEHCRDKQLLMNLPGVTPSERKHFRKMQRLKMQALAQASHNSEQQAKMEMSARLPETMPKSSTLYKDTEDIRHITHGLGNLNSDFTAAGPSSRSNESEFIIPKRNTRRRGRGGKVAN